MATIPSLEAILLEINKSLGGVSFSSKKKNKFLSNSMELNTSIEMIEELFESITNRLNLDDNAKDAIFKNFSDTGSFYKSVELNTWTGGATSQQIIWLLLAYIYIPGFARYMAFWNLDAITDKGMSGGYFWYLPEIKEKQGETYLHFPVAQVVDWLLDLLGIPAISELAIEYRQKADPNDVKTDKLIRTLYNWHSSNSTPNPSKIEEFFPDGLSLDFKGIFEINSQLSHTEQFSATLEFLKNKFDHADIDSIADKVRQEIPMTQEGLLEAVLNNKTDESMEQKFIELIAIRYSKPSPKMIRHYLLIARMMQDGYIRLSKFLFPDIDVSCTDPSLNKLLQLIMLYKHVYNLTIEAFRHNNNEKDENKWFEENIHPALSKFLISITPSFKETAYMIVAEILTDAFFKVKPADELEDIYPYNENVLVSMSKCAQRQAKKDLKELNALEKINSINNKSILINELQKETNFKIVSKFTGANSLTFQQYKLALKRLSELAQTPFEKIEVIFQKLHYYLNGNPQQRPKNVSLKVQELIEEAEKNDAYDLWQAPLLQIKAKHFLYQNDFENANKLFREALNTCSEYNYGMLRGEIARDLFATEVANKKLIHENHQRYFREMMYYGVQEVAQIGFEDIAVQCAEYFWDTLYKPYPDIDKIKPILITEMESIYKVILPLLDQDNMEAIEQWLKKKGKKFATSLHYVRGDTLLMHWIKGYSHFKAELPKLYNITPEYLKNDMNRFTNLIKNWGKMTHLIVKHAPQLLNIVDFKKQSPLMLIAQEGDASLLKSMFDNGADPNLQDYIGRTALHTAIAGYKNDCVDLLLDYPCVLDKLADNRWSVLHTSVKAGNLYAAKRVIQLMPRLKDLTGRDVPTPIEYAKCLLNDQELYFEHHSYMKSMGKKSVSTEDLKSLIQLLS